MKFYLLSIAIFISCLSCFGQLVLEQNATTKKFSFRNGITQVKISGSYDYVNTGKLGRAGVVNPTDFDEELSVAEMVADVSVEQTTESPREFFPTSANTQPHYIPVRNAGVWGLIDSLGRVVLPLKYKTEPVAIAKNIFTVPNAMNQTEVINREGKVLHTVQRILFLQQAVIPYEQDGEWGLMDTNGNLLLNPKELRKVNITIPRINNDINIIRGLLIFKKENKYGVMDMKGKIVHPADYSKDIKILDEQNAIIASKDGRQYGAVLDDGKIVVDFSYSQLRYWGAFIGTKKEGSETVIQFPVPDDADKRFAPLDIDNSNSSNASGLVVIIKGKYGLLNVNTGKYVLEPAYDKIITSANGDITTKTGTTYTLSINDTPRYKGIYIPYNYYPGSPFIKLTNNGREGLFDTRTQTIFLAPQNVFVLLYEKDKKYFVITKRDYQDPLPCVLTGQGEKYLPPFAGSLSFVEGVDRPLFFLDSKSTNYQLSDRETRAVALLDESLKEIPFPKGYDYWKPFTRQYNEKKTLYWFAAKNSKWALFDKDFRLILPAEYSVLEFRFTHDYLHYKKQGKEGLLKTSDLIR